MHTAIATLTGAALAVSIAAAAPAQNLVANGDFDDDILDGENLDATKQWNEFDPFGDPFDAVHLPEPGAMAGLVAIAALALLRRGRAAGAAVARLAETASRGREHTR